MATAQHVTREINLIARQFECQGAEKAAMATADHIKKFWAPLLKSALLNEARINGDLFSPIARNAFAILG